MKQNIFAGLDLGTTKVCAIIAEKKENGSFEILGFGSAPSVGLSKGMVVNIAKTAEAIVEAMSIARNKAGIDITELNVGVAGEHIKIMRYLNYVTINNPEREVTQLELDRLHADVKMVQISEEKQIIHIIPEQFTIDNQIKVDNPIGMAGQRLEAAHNVVMAATTALTNIRKSVERAGYTVKNFILQPIASSLSVLEEEETDVGVALIDIGGGTTDMAVFEEKRIKHTKVIGIAGNMVTNDIRESLGIVTAEAEKLKREHGYTHESAIIRDQEIFIKRVGARGNIKIPTSLLTQIIHARMKELFEILNLELENSKNKEKLKAGLVLTGGGSMLKGCVELAEEVFGVPARIGYPIDLAPGLSSEIGKPEYATVVGLIKNIPGNEDEGSEVAEIEPEIKEEKKKKDSSVGKLLQRIIQFFDEL